jgi:prepilin-type N-terminal cleavage/methylation domain-containing protein
MGFTLIELMVSVLIIGILTGITLGVLNVRQIKARTRDSQRVSDLSTIQTALELYFADNHHYPIQETWTLNISGLDSGTFSTNYLKSVPIDPISNTSSFDSSGNSTFCTAGISQHAYWYATDSTGDTYILMAIMELESSAEGNLASNLSNCDSENGTISCGFSAEGADPYCYGVQDPH